MPPTNAARSARPAGRPVSLAQLLLEQVVSAREAPSRAQLAATTGLSRATVSLIVDQLVTAGLVRELDPLPSQRAGRPAVPLAPAPGTVAGLGLEVNVDYLGLRALDLAGRVLTERVVYGDLRGEGAPAVLDRLAGLAAGALRDLADWGIPVAGTSLALPGLVDHGSGPLRVAPNLGWRELDVVALLVRHPALAQQPPVLANEANLAAKAELRLREPGASFVYVSGEVGIGGAVVLDGRPVPGRHGWGGEIGHVVVRPELGEEGTLERLVGQDRLLRGAGLPPDARVADLAAALAAGEPTALAVVHRAADDLGLALASVVNLLDLDEVVLGGPLGQLVEHLREGVQARLREHVLFAPWVSVQVTAAAAGDLPALTGGAWSALRGVLDDPEAWIAARR